MNRNLALEFVRVTEMAAIASARLMGRGDEKAADRGGAWRWRARGWGQHGAGDRLSAFGQRAQLARPVQR